MQYIIQLNKFLIKIYTNIMIPQLELDTQLSNFKQISSKWPITLYICTVFFSFLWHRFEKKKRKSADQLKSCLISHLRIKLSFTFFY